MKYVKKPIVIEAVQWTGENYEEISDFAGECLIESKEGMKIKTDAYEGILSFGDYIVKSENLGVYISNPEFFEKTYEQVVD